jgi:pyruvate decarboxylase
MPLDLSMEHVAKSLLDTPIDTSLPVDAAAQDAAVDAILETLAAARNPCLFVDGLVQRYAANDECRALAKKLQLPVYAANMGKSIIDETEPYFAGMYQGVVSDPEILEAVEASDCVVQLGSIAADTNSGGLSRKFNKDAGVEIYPNNVVVSCTSLQLHSTSMTNAIAR